MAKNKFDNITFNKSMLQVPPTPPTPPTTTVDENKKDLIEEYKILQTKIDSYGVVLIRFRGIMFSLLSAIFLFAYEKDLANLFFSKAAILFLVAYFLYYEFITEHARNIFQKRIAEIELALKNEYIAKRISTFNIAESSTKIKAGFLSFIFNFHNDTKAWITVIGPIIVMVFGSFYVDLSKETKDNELSVVNKQVYCQHKLYTLSKELQRVGSLNDRNNQKIVDLLRMNNTLITDCNINLLSE